VAVAPLRRHLAAPVHAGPTRGRRARQPRPPRAAQRHRGHQAGALGEHPTGPAPRGVPRPRPGRRAARTARMGPGPLVTPTPDEARLPPLPVVGCRSCEPGLPTPTSAGTLGFSQPGGGGRCAPRLRGCGFRRGWRRRRCCRHGCEPPGRRTPPAGDQPQSGVVEVAIHRVSGERLLRERLHPAHPEHRCAAIRPHHGDLGAGHQITQAIEDPGVPATLPRPEPGGTELGGAKLDRATVGGAVAGLPLMTIAEGDCAGTALDAAESLSVPAATMASSAAIPTNALKRAS